MILKQGKEHTQSDPQYMTPLWIDISTKSLVTIPNMNITVPIIICTVCGNKKEKSLTIEVSGIFYFLKYCSIITDIIILYGTHISHPEAKKCQLHNLLYQCRLKINTYEKKLPPRISGLLSSQVQAFSLRFTVIP